jgi:hypothetical protein
MVVINGVDLSDHATQGTFTENADMLDSSKFGDRAHAKTPGLLDSQLQIDFLQDFAASKVHQTLFPLVGAAPFTVAFRPVNAAKSVTNPEYTFQAILQNFDPSSGQVGTLLKTSVTFLSAGDVTRAIA